MKLIFCRACQDVVKLQLEPRTCLCGKSSGYYRADGVHAQIAGPCVPLGINNASFGSALIMQDRCSPGSPSSEELQGLEFAAFVIHPSSDRVKRDAA